MDQNAAPIHLPETAEELRAITLEVEQLLRQSAEALVSVPEGQRTIANTLLKLQEAQSEAAARQTRCTFPQMVHLDKDVREAATDAKKSLQKAWSLLFSRRDVYAALCQLDENQTSDPEIHRLLQHTLRLFKRHGAALAEPEQQKLMKLRSEISGLELDFQKALNEDTTEILLSEHELQGCSEAWLSGLKRAKKEGGDDLGVLYYRVTMKTPDILNISRNASLPETRQRVATTYRQVCTGTNGPILDRLIQLRHEAAILLGYKSHAAYQLDINMAKTVENVESFLDNITTSISGKLADDKKELLALKKAEYERRGWSQKYDGKLNAWDVKYYQEILLSEKYAVDNTLLTQYFELNNVRDQIMGVYSKIFQLRFEQIPGKYWADDVTLFAVYDQKAQNDAGEAGHKDTSAFKLGYFYLDLFPRPGKYSHQCVVPMRPSYVNSNGERVLPVAVNVGNLSRPTADRPALLKHSEANTFFHEFGHVCHAMSSKARFSLFNFSWAVVPYPTSLAMDFLEVPSIMLENWLWEPTVLKRLGRHYKTGEELPDDLINSLVKTRKVIKGLLFTQQVAMTAIDLRLHSMDPHKRTQSIAEFWRETSEGLVGVTLEHGPNVNPACQLYHIVTGYDAGYYVYAYSESQAHDLYTRFTQTTDPHSHERTRAMDGKLGREYWEKVLVPGATKEPIELLRDFLGREPNADAFQRYLTEP